MKRERVKKHFKFAMSAATVALLGATITQGQQPAAATGSTATTAVPAQGQSSVQKNVEAFLRHYYALGPEISITVGTPKEIGTSGLMETPVDVKTPEGSEKVNMFLTKDGRYLIRGEVSDLTSDPLADTRAKIITTDAPMWGNQNAPITLVEYSDFQCPVCRSLHDALRGLLPNYPQVKVVFKDYPLETLHPWARTAALAGRCAYQQDPKAFWKVYDLIYDNQELISAGNVYDKMLDFAGQAGLNRDAFKACLSSPQAAQAIDASVANGNLLEVRSTPTVFVNGRRIVGADPHAVQQYIDYEVAQLKAEKAK
jgi:protein-disulfide isomerase